MSFLSVILMNKSFRKGNFSTKFLEKEYPNAYQNYSLNNAELQKLSAAVLALYKNYEYLTTDNYYEFAQSEVIENKYFVDTGLNQFHLDWNFNDKIHEIKEKKIKFLKSKFFTFHFLNQLN